MSSQYSNGEEPKMGLSKSQQTLLPKMREWMQNSDLAIALSLAALTPGSSHVSWTRRQMNILQKRIQKDSASIAAAHQANQLLAKLVTYANKVGLGPFPQPSLSNLTSRPHNPFAGGVTNETLCVRAWLEVERKWIDDCADLAPVELVIFSALLHGGLLHATSLTNLARALLAEPAQSLGCTANRVYIDLTLPWRGLPNMENRRWYPDDQTTCLIRRRETYSCQADWNNPELLSDEQMRNKLSRRINERMTSHGVPNHLRRAALTQLADVVAVTARTEVPAVVVEYAARHIVSHSLKPAVLARIFDRPYLIEKREERIQFDETLELEQDQLKDQDNPDDEESEWLTDLRSAFHTTDRRELQRRLKTQLESFSNTRNAGQRITHFAHYLLTERHLEHGRFALRRPWAMGTVKSLAITTVGRRLGGMLGGQDPVALTVENLETTYSNVLGNVAEGNNPGQLRGKVAYALREFQDFLVSQCGAIPLDDQSLLRGGRGLLAVDARIITLEEYTAALLFIDSERRKYGDNVKHAARAMLILGFRCGLRRMEAHGLEINDLTDRNSPWLLVRPTEARQLKTDNARRQLPLACLIPEDELEILYSWKKKRMLNRASKDCSHLFAVPESTLTNGTMVYELIPVNTLIQIIHRALRRKTNDGKLHFHHLRHSFATWTFLRLMLSDLAIIPEIFSHLIATSVWLKDAKAFAQRLYGMGQPTRKHAMAVASLLGHSGPVVSLEHYIHCMDLLLPAFLSQSKLLAVASTNRVVKATANPHSALYKAKLEGGAGSIPMQEFLRRFPEFLVADAPSPIVADGAAPGSWADNTWDLLFLRGTTNESLDSLVDKLGFSVGAAELMIARANEIRQITEARGMMCGRHAMISTALPGPAASRGNPSSWPKLPQRAHDKQVIEKTELAILSLAHAEPLELTKVLDYFVHNAWRTSSALFFRNPDEPDDAIRYVNFLKSIGYPNSRIRFVSFDHRNRYTSWSIWMKALNLSRRRRDRIEICNPPFKQSSASDIWLGIVPDFAVQGPGAIELALVPPSRDTAASIPGAARAGSKGFRFTMVMAAISFGYKSEAL